MWSLHRSPLLATLAAAVPSLTLIGCSMTSTDPLPRCAESELISSELRQLRGVEISLASTSCPPEVKCPVTLLQQSSAWEEHEQVVKTLGFLPSRYSSARCSKNAGYHAFCTRSTAASRAYAQWQSSFLPARSADMDYNIAADALFLGDLLAFEEDLQARDGTASQVDTRIAPPTYCTGGPGTQVVLSFPQEFGRRFVKEIRAQLGSVAISQFLRRPPSNTEQIIANRLSPSKTPILPSTPALGPLLTYALVRNYFPHEVVQPILAGFRADELHYEDDNEFSWETSWASPEHATAFAEHFCDTLSLRFGSLATHLHQTRCSLSLNNTHLLLATRSDPQRVLVRGIVKLHEELHQRLSDEQLALLPLAER